MPACSDIYAMFCLTAYPMFQACMPRFASRTPSSRRILCFRLVCHVLPVGPLPHGISYVSGLYATFCQSDPSLTAYTMFTTMGNRLMVDFSPHTTQGSYRAISQAGPTEIRFTMKMAAFSIRRMFHYLYGRTFLKHWIMAQVICFIKYIIYLRLCSVCKPMLVSIWFPLIISRHSSFGNEYTTLLVQLAIYCCLSSTYPVIIRWDLMCTLSKVDDGTFFPPCQK